MQDLSSPTLRGNTQVELYFPCTVDVLMASFLNELLPT